MTDAPTRAPLAGRRIVITRAAEQADELAQQLAMLGAEALVVPLIQIIEPTDAGRALADALDRLGDYDWFVVTSPNGASRVGERIAALGADRPLLAAIGASTAAALTLASRSVPRASPPVEVDLVPRRQIAEGLIDEFPLAERGGRVLIVQAESARSTLADGLIAKGWQVDTVVAYRTLPIRPTAGVLLGVIAADALLLASGSAARAWLQVFGSSTPSVVVAIGPATAAVATEIGLKVDAIATDHSVGGLVTCLLTHLGDRD